MVPPGQNAAMIANRNVRALTWRQICERHGGSGPRGSHQWGKTPIRPFPSRTSSILLSFRMHAARRRDKNFAPRLT